MPKPLANLTIPKANEIDVKACEQNEVPLTPITPISAEGLVSLRNLIIEQDASALDETHKQNLQRHLHKLAKAALNNEAKVRQSTKSLVLGKAKGIGYEELVEAREKRAKKDA
ncbi:hypothetical protein BDW02DRAFT_455946, partial [Decorospora gaudefroyi]